MRRYDDDIEVRSGGGDDRLPQGAPEIFIWRGRLYRVRSVLDRWVERRPWWREAFDRPRPGSTDVAGPAARIEAGAPVPCRPHGGGEGVVPSDVPESRSPATLCVADLEREVWRVEAAAGASCAPGVYDLARAGAAASERDPDAWRLLAMSD